MYQVLRSLRFRAVEVLSAILIAFLFLTISIPTIAKAEAVSSVPGEYLAKFSKKTSVAKRKALKNALGVKSLKYNKVSRTELIKLSSSFDVKLAKDLLASGELEYFEPNYILHAFATPNDTYYAEQWGLHNSGQNGGTADIDVDGPAAWDTTTGSTGVVVGVIDTGVNYNHPDLAANMWTNTNETPSNGIDDDANGIVDDYYGYNAISNNGNPLDDNGHGSHVAGITAAYGNNGVGISGVAWRSKIMALKFLNAAGSGTTQGAIDTIEYAVTMKNLGVNLKVVNASWGGGGFSQALEDAISALNNAGVLFVAAAGNSAQDNDSSSNYPANYDVANIISVAALDNDGNLASFSNYGLTTVDVAAPGVDILSTYLNNQYAYLDGTSMATPFVTGIAALLAANSSSMSVSSMKSRILNTVKPLSSLNGLVVSPGVASASRALANTVAPTPPPATLISYTDSAISINYDTSLGTKVFNQDDGYYTTTIPFSFSYYDVSYSRISISANGRILLLDGSDAVPTESDFSNRVGEGINIYNDDLYPSPFSSDGGVWFKSDATSATITWVVTPYGLRNSGTSNSEIRIQAKIFSNGIMQFHYLDTLTGDTSYDYGASASVGLAPASGVSGEKLTITHNAALEAKVGSSKALSLSNGDVASVKNDFDADGKSDLVVYRPTTGMFYISPSGTGFNLENHQSYQLGLPGDIPFTGDFDGDGQSDLAVWRPSDGNWFIRYSADSYASYTAIQWGLPGDTPLTGDFDGDGKNDLAVYRVNSSMFYVLLSSQSFNREGALNNNIQSYYAVSLGGPANDAVVGDFTGDGKDDFTVIWQLIRFWTIKNASGEMVSSQPWGEPGDTPMGCDWDGDGSDERVVSRVNANFTLDWFAVTSSGGVYTNNFGSLGDTPSCNKDYDGDGKGDVAVFRNASGQWFFKKSSNATMRSYFFGLPGDIPL